MPAFSVTFSRRNLGGVGVYPHNVFFLSQRVHEPDLILRQVRSELRSESGKAEVSISVITPSRLISAMNPFVFIS